MKRLTTHGPMKPLTSAVTLAAILWDLEQVQNTVRAVKMLRSRTLQDADIFDQAVDELAIAAQKLADVQRYYFQALGEGVVPASPRSPEEKHLVDALNLIPEAVDEAITIIQTTARSWEVHHGIDVRRILSQLPSTCDRLKQRGRGRSQR